MTMTNNPGSTQPTLAPLRRIQPQGSAAAVTRYLKTQWPRIGGRHVRPLPDHAFSDPAFVEGYIPGTITYVYDAACGFDFLNPHEPSGLKGIADRFQMPIYKVAATESADPRRRLKILNRDRYASGLYGPEGFYEEPGFRDWTFQQFLPNRDPLANSPVSLEGRMFRLRRPHDMDKRAFEKLLHQRMKDASFNEFLLTPEGRVHCATLGLDPVREQRYTNYRFGETPRIDKAEELYIFRPDGEDSDRLLMILEALMHGWVTGTVQRPPPSWRDDCQFKRRG